MTLSTRQVSLPMDATSLEELNMLAGGTQGDGKARVI